MWQLNLYTVASYSRVKTLRLDIMKRIRAANFFTQVSLAVYELVVKKFVVKINCNNGQVMREYIVSFVLYCINMDIYI